ncbi:DUF2062 domain-containing protein [Bacillus sp. DNRA2]|uniref:DUF2062 domain-containing protein n=1 Tax=Bacillus sp. DNRA2 TaxID=2723053 RepID=UPI00145EDDC7|nr:DUF2062 domain-containing protein [Bacillus sp. DNRA2]NMD68667.1 DUF2062 domain-containing protein [Bacillus sp. DNRA2]
MKLKSHVKYYLLRLFRLKAGTHSIAMGLTLGFIPHWFPTFGVGALLSLGLAKLGRGNLVAAFLGGALGTAIWPFLFFLNYKIGSLLFRRSTEITELKSAAHFDFSHLSIHGIGSGGLLFFTGALVNTLLSFLFMYLIVYTLFKKHRVNILYMLKRKKEPS